MSTLLSHVKACGPIIFIYFGYTSISGIL